MQIYESIRTWIFKKTSRGDFIKRIFEPTENFKPAEKKLRLASAGLGSLRAYASFKKLPTSDLPE
jgi:hypothetical protein